MSPCSVQRVRAIVEHAHADAQAIARVLRSRGAEVVLCEPEELDRTLPPHDAFYADPWTSEVAPRIRASRRGGVVTSSIGDLVLEQCARSAIGITGTAGKSSTAALVRDLLASSGCTVVASTTARAGNLWPSHDVLAQVQDLRADARVCLELTSTHLCFMSRSPQIAVVTNVWADHVELHGSERRYRAAKRAILEHQGVDGWAVLNADDPGSARLRGAVVGRCAWVSLRRGVRQGVGVESGRLVARLEGRIDDLGTAPAGPFAVNVACACAAALLAGADPARVRERWPRGVALPFRQSFLGIVDGVRVIDDGLAATPSKAAIGLAALDPATTVVIAGGHRSFSGAVVHDSAAERAQVERFCGVLAAMRGAVVFGGAGAHLATRVPRAAPASDLRAAWDEARALAVPGCTIVLAPGYPLTLEERAAFARYASSGAIAATE